MSTPAVAVTPQLTLTATLQDQTGKPIPKAQLVITLCGYGPTIPRITGTSLLAKVGPVEYTLTDGTTTAWTTIDAASGGPGIPLWGNDVITPTGTYYAVSIVDQKKNVVQCGIYQFTGGPQTIDLSSAAQIDASTGFVPPLNYLTWDLWNVGAGQGTNVYLLTHTPYNGQLVGLYRNGILQIPGQDYTVSGRTITLNFTTQPGDTLFAEYVASEGGTGGGPIPPPTPPFDLSLFVRRAGDTMTGPLTIDVASGAGNPVLTVESDTGAATVKVSGAHNGAGLSLFDLAAPTDEQQWTINATTDQPSDAGHGLFSIGTVNTAATVSNPALQITRIGNTPQTVKFPVGITTAKITDSVSQTGAANQIATAAGDGSWKWTNSAGGAPNILFDSFNSHTYTFPTLGGWTWYPSGIPAFSTSSPNILLPTPVAQLPAAAQFVKAWDFARLGLAIGDIITVSALAYFPTTSGGKIAIHFYNSGGTDIGAVGPPNSLVSGLQVISFTTTVPAATASIRVFVSNGSASTAFEVGGIFASKGAVAPSLTKGEDALTLDKAWFDASFYGSYGNSIAQNSTAINTIAPIGKNLANPNDPSVALGFFVSNVNGQLSPNASYNSTGYVPMVAGQTYTRSYSHQMAFYDSNLNYVSGRPATGTPNVPETFTVPAGCVYARFSCITGAWSVFQVELGSTATSYAAYARTVVTSLIQTANIADGAVTLPKTAFSAVGKNIVNINAADVALGFFVSSANGTLSANASYNSTGYVPMVAGQTYTRSYSHQMAFYDANKVYVSGRPATGTPNLPETFAVPAGCVYARFTCIVGAWSVFQVELGSTATPWVAYALTIDPAVLPPITASQLPPIQTSNLADGAVTLPKTAFAATGKNKFNINAADVAIGFFVNNANGTLSANATYNSTGYVPMVAGQTYTRSYSHNMAFYDANKVYVSGRPALGNPGLAETFTVPTGCVFARFTVLASLWATFQVELGSTATPWEAYYYAIDPAALPPSVANQSARLNQCTTPAGSLLVDPYRANLLRQTHYKLMKLGLLPTPEATQLVINCVGDSYTQFPSRWSGPFATHLITKFGDAGGGFCGFGFNPSGTVNTPPWTTGNQPSYIGGNIRPASYPVVLLGNITAVYNTAPSPNLATATLSATGDEITVNIPATPIHNGCDLFFVGTANGVIRYSWDNGTTWTNVNVQGTVGAVQTVSIITGLPAVAGKLRIQWWAGTVTLCGVNLISAASGVRCNILAGTGSNVSQWANAPAGSLEAGWGALAAHLFIQMDGTNSQIIGYTASQWSGYTSTLVGRMRAATPGVDILIATPPENQLGKPIPMSSYAVAGRDLSFTLRFAFVDMQNAFGDPTNPTEYGYTGAVPLFMSDLTHPDPPTGGRALVFQFLEAVMPR